MSNPAALLNQLASAVDPEKVNEAQAEKLITELKVFLSLFYFMPTSF